MIPSLPSGPIPDWFGTPEVIHDQDVIDYLKSKTMNPFIERWVCSTEVAEHWHLPYTEADKIVGQVMITTYRTTGQAQKL